MDTKRCKKCGIPLAIVKKYKLMNNGTLGLIVARNVWFEVDNFRFLYSELEKRIGASLENLVTEVSSKVAKEYMEYIFKGWKLSLLRKFSFLFELIPLKYIGKSYTEEAQIWGWGTINLELYRGRKKAILYYKNIPLLSLIGIVKGGMSGVWNIPTKMTIEKRGIYTARTIIELAPTESKVAPYLELFKQKFLPGNINYELCHQCKTPLLVSKIFQWDWQNGFVWQRKSRKRWAGLLTHYFLTTFKSLEREISEEIPTIVMEIEKEYMSKNFIFPELFQKKENIYSKIFNPLLWGVLGWGNPVKVEKKDQTLQVRIDNPFNEPILAGIVGGIYEIVEGVKARVEWTENINGYFITTVYQK